MRYAEVFPVALWRLPRQFSRKNRLFEVRWAQLASACRAYLVDDSEHYVVLLIRVAVRLFQLYQQ